MVSDRKTIMYIILIIYIILNGIIFFTTGTKIYLLLINPLLLLGISFLFFYLSRDNNKRVRKKRDKFKTGLMVVLFYILIYYLSGLMFGFLKNGHELSFKGIIANFIIYFAVALMQEFIRNRLVVSAKKKWELVFITFLFIVMNVDWHYFITNFKNIILIKYFFSDLVSLIIMNMTLTYLDDQTGPKLSYFYRGVMTAISCFSPILPNHEWLITCFLSLMVFGLIVILIERDVSLDERRMSRREARKNNPISFYPLLGFCLLFILFLMGVFKYFPVAIMSDSMVSYFYRGDIVIVEKVNQKEKEEIKVGDVIYYLHDGIYITHRVVDIIEVDQKIIYKTKGDNNNTVDTWDVKEDDVEGIIRGRVKYLGWPSVLVAESFKKNK